MLIIIKNTPKDVGIPHWRELLNSTIADTFWWHRGKLLDVQILQAETPTGGVVERHCLAVVEPEAAARRMVRNLNGRYSLGIKLRVSEYVVRNWHNDRRQDGAYKHMPREQRCRDRRRYFRLCPDRKTGR
jgi:hypothetical protein